MKLTELQKKRLAEHVLLALEEKASITYKVPREKVHERLVQEIQRNISEEMEIEAQTHRHLDKLEKTHGGEFQRYKMFPLVKRKVAEERGFVL